MENRRQYNPNSTNKPFNRNKFQQRPNERYSNDRSFQPREARFQSKEGSYQPRGDKFQPREGGYQNRDNRFQNRPTNRFNSKKRFDPKTRPAPAWKKVSLPKVYSEMQVTDGKHRGKFFETTASPKVRPTTRRLRETMFRIISRRVRAKRFLDLCAGSGAVGLEAISRGALLGTFVERSAKMCSFIRKNMTAMGIKEGHGEIFEIEVVPFLKRMAKRKRQWDVVFLDPPYDTNYDEILENFSRGVCVKRGGTLIIEHHAEMFFPEKIGVMKRWRVIVEGESALSFYERT